MSADQAITDRLLATLAASPSGLALGHLFDRAFPGRNASLADVYDVLVGLENARLVVRFPTEPQAYVLSELGRDAAEARRLIAARALREESGHPGRVILLAFVVCPLLWLAALLLWRACA